MTSTADLAGCYRSVGSLEKALPLYQKAAEGIEKLQFQHEFAGQIFRTSVPVSKRPGSSTMRNTGDENHDGGRGVEGVANVRGEFGSGLNLLQQRKWTKAQTTLAECLSIRQKTQPDAWTTFNTQSMLGESLPSEEVRRRRAVADQGLRRNEGAQKTIPPQGKTRIPEALDRLVRLYDAMGEKDEAAKWRKELVAAKKWRGLASVGESLLQMPLHFQPVFIDGFRGGQAHDRRCGRRTRRGNYARLPVRRLGGRGSWAKSDPSRIAVGRRRR